METPESCLPDTGCTQSIISADLAKRIGANIDSSAKIQLLTANGSSMTVLGQARLYMQLKDKTTVTYAIVASGVSHPALISWHDLKYLGVISSTFPSASCSVVSPAKLCEQVLQAFPTVYRDEITETPMVGEPVKIHLKDNAIPFRISVARQVPLRFQEQAEKAIQHLLDSKIITRCDKPTAWCSPGFFVVKGDGKSVRLVTDYTKLNSFVNRPVHPFPSVTDILKSISATAKHFAKFDAVNGYFQIPLEAASSELTTFILPSGRYRYLRIPQGLNASSDEWCRRSDAVVEGLLWARKIVDDILIWASDLTTLHSRINEVSIRCKSLNVILSRKNSTQERRRGDLVARATKNMSPETAAAHQRS